MFFVCIEELEKDINNLKIECDSLEYSLHSNKFESTFKKINEDIRDFTNRLENINNFEPVLPKKSFDVQLEEINNRISEIQNKIDIYHRIIKEFYIKDPKIDFFSLTNELKTLEKNFKDFLFSLDSIETKIKTLPTIIYSPEIFNPSQLEFDLDYLEKLKSITERVNEMEALFEILCKIKLIESEAKKSLKIFSTGEWAGFFDPLEDFEKTPQGLKLYSLMLFSSKILINNWDVEAIQTISLENLYSLKKSNYQFSINSLLNICHLIQDGLSILVLFYKNSKIVIFPNGHLVFLTLSKIIHYNPCINLVKIYDKDFCLINTIVPQQIGDHLKILDNLSISYSMPIINQVSGLEFKFSEFSLNITYKDGNVEEIKSF